MWTKKDLPNQTGKTILITGANTGLGYETAQALYEVGAHVILACRNEQKAEAARRSLVAQGGTGTLESAVLDLANLNQVHQFAQRFVPTHPQLHVLINNAGVATPPPSKTAQGYELQFGVNFLGHFALTGYLYPLLKSTPGARVVTLSSNGYQNARIDFTNLRSEQSYDPLREYRQSKLADLLFSIELHRRIVAAGDSVASIAAQPGANKTQLTRHLSEEAIAAGIQRLGAFMDPWQGALTTLYAAVSPEATSGHLYEPDQDGYRGYPALATIGENAQNPVVASQLWTLAEQSTNVYFPLH